MKSVFIRELERYSKSKIMEIIGNKEKIFNQLQEYAVIDKENDLYHFKYVGVIIIESCVINCYPKYITKTKTKTKLPGDSITCIQKQICIKNQKAIKNIIELEHNNVTKEVFNLIIYNRGDKND